MRLNGMDFSFSTGVLCFSPLCVFNIFIYFICVEYVLCFLYILYVLNMCVSMGCISVSKLECFAQSLRTLLKVWACTKGGEECINIHTELCCVNYVAHIQRQRRIQTQIQRQSLGVYSIYAKSNQCIWDEFCFSSSIFVSFLCTWFPKFNSNAAFTSFFSRFYQVLHWQQRWRDARILHKYSSFNF